MSYPTKFTLFALASASLFGETASEFTPAPPVAADEINHAGAPRSQGSQTTGWLENFNFKTELTPTIGSITLGAFGENTDKYFTGQAYTGADYGMMGIGLAQSFGWSDWIRLEFRGDYAHSVVGGSNNDIIGLPSRAETYDVSGLVIGSIPLASDATFNLEPCLGFDFLDANFERMVGTYVPASSPSLFGVYNLSEDYHPWHKMRFYGPEFGLYTVAKPFSGFSIRAGGSYVMTRLRDQRDQNNPFMVSHGTMRRHTLMASLRFDYALYEYAHLFMNLDYQTWSAAYRDSTTVLEDDSSLNALAPQLKRSRLKFGAAWAY